jgi:hypothetical protein
LDCAFEAIDLDRFVCVCLSIMTHLMTDPMPERLPR